MADRIRDRALKATAAYFVVAAGYIIGSGYLLFFTTPSDPEAYLTIEIVKGVGFVGITSVLLYVLLRRSFAASRREAALQADVEQQLRRSRDQLAAAQRIARLGSWQADLDTGKLYWSDEVYRIFGVAPQDFGHSIEAFLAYVHEDDRDALSRAQRESLDSGRPLEIEHRIVRPDGERRYVLERARVSGGDGKPRVQIGTVQDITERKRVELELEHRSRQQAAIAELGLQALAGSDVRALMERAMACATEALDVELAGVLERLPGGDSLRLVSGIGWPAQQLGRLTVAAGRGSHAGYTLAVDEPVVVEELAGETRFRPLQGLLDLGVTSAITAVVHDGDAPWGVLGLYTTRRRRFTEADVSFVQSLANLIGDVLQRERAASAIRERDILRQLAAEAAALGGWAYDPDSGVLTWSEEVHRIHEVTPDFEPDVESGIAFYAPEHRDRVRECFEACVREGVPYDEELQIVTGRDRRIWVRVIGRAERDAAGRVVRVHGSIQDISERKALESMLHQSQRLEAIGQLTGGIAHDFNNLLTVILGNADQVASLAGDDAELLDLAETTRRAASRGAELTNRLLAYARKQPLEPEPTNVAELLAAMDPLLRRSLGEQIEIELVRGGGLWTAMVDPAQLESAVLNLCLNARDAMPDGGRLTIETANVHLDSDYAEQHGDIAPGQYVMIAVTDTGRGVSPEMAERVFEPFFTTKPAGQGSGLGLSMVYGFVKQSRGHVKLYSEPGQGTTVRIYLPRTWDDARPSIRPAPPTGSARGRGELILVVEDDDLVRSFVADQVAALGYDVLAAANATEAMAILEQRSDVDLLFTDVVMPGSMDGRQLADAAHAIHPDLPVLFTSGYTENAIVHQGRLDPGVALLNKPYRLADLAKKLDAVLHPTDGD